MTQGLDPRYADVLHRRVSADGTFWIGVTTTHVVCKPSCPSRTPLPAHLEYFDSVANALSAGFRPCKRCRPLGESSRVALREAQITTPLGEMVAIGTEHGLALLEFTDRPMLRTQRERVRHLFASEILPGSFPARDEVQAEMDAYFAGRLEEFRVPLLPLGTPFQRAVWRALLGIPHGQTTSYDALAAQAGRPGAARAAGRANGDNRLSIIVPCHRVIGSDGDLTGYGGGLWRKRALLELEGAALLR
ncbi:MAG: methylated-DNA--[protein]-cysteine S-methyltransferase [Gemmatimonadetes bacterium]|nr:methylated-DNA--[protein]-cysteine S-methyltransferase [Gemmatimonadota bacterium]